MRKLLVIFLSALMLLGIFGGALAHAEDAYAVPDIAPADQALDNNENGLMNSVKVKDLQGYDRLLQLREAARAMRAEIKSDRVVIIRLVKEAKKAKNQDALTTLKNGLAAIKQIQAERVALWSTQKQNWAEMKAARKAKDQAKMQDILTNKIIPTRIALNEKLQAILSAQNDLIQQFSNPAPAPGNPSN